VASYRAYFLNQAFRIAHVENFEEASDAEALAHAKALLGARSRFSAFELWDDNRAVRLIRRPTSRGEAR
jgi:hypothetical protein